MHNLSFPDEQFDIVWSEGAVYPVGFGRALKEWKRVLKPNGFMVLHDACEDFNAKFAHVSAAGYHLITHFLLPKGAWWELYYEPLELRIQELRNDEVVHPAYKRVLDEKQKEIEMVKPVAILAIGNTAMRSLKNQDGGIMTSNATTEWRHDLGAWVTYCVSPMGMLFGFVGGAIGMILVSVVLLLVKSPLFVFPSLIVAFYESGIEGVFANKFGGWKAALTASFLGGVILSVGILWLQPLTPQLAGTGTQFGNIDTVLVIAPFSWLFRAIGAVLGVAQPLG